LSCGSKRARRGLKFWSASSDARQLVLEGLVSMSQVERELDPDQLNEELPYLLTDYRREIQEVLVHSFDFLYFYYGVPDFYIESIWHSWCAIPGIEDRVQEYLMRTLCAVSATLLKEQPSKRLLAVLRHTKGVLEKLKTDETLLSNYVVRALHIIEELERDTDAFRSFEKAYSPRLYLVRTVAIFLHSERLSARLFADPHVGSKDYGDKQRLRYDLEPVGNPLRFLKAYLKQNPSEAESLWILHALAFDTVDGKTV
jgi:hypothetical protein